MTIYTTKQALQKKYKLTRYKFEYLFKLGVIKKVRNQREEKVGYLFIKLA